MTIFDIVSGNSVKDRNLSGWNEIGNCGSLCPMSHEKIAASGIAQTADDFSRAEAIAIGFHRRPARGRSLRLQKPPVGNESSAIEMQTNG